MKKGESTFVYFRLSASTKRFLDTTANQFLSPRQIKKKRKPSLQPELGENNAEIEMDTCVLYLCISISCKMYGISSSHFSRRAYCLSWHFRLIRYRRISAFGASLCFRRVSGTFYFAFGAQSTRIRRSINATVKDPTGLFE